MDIKEFAEKYIKAWQEALLNGKFSSLEALIDPASVYHAPGSDLSREAYKQHIVDMRKYAQIIKVDWEYLTGEGNLFAVDFRGCFKFTGEMPGFPTITGKEMTSHYLCLLHVKNGKVIESWTNGSITVVD